MNVHPLWDLWTVIPRDLRSPRGFHEIPYVGISRGSQAWGSPEIQWIPVEKNIHTRFGFFVRESSSTIPSARRRFWKSLGQPAGPSGFSKSTPGIGDPGEDSLQKPESSIHICLRLEHFDNFFIFLVHTYLSILRRYRCLIWT